MSHDGKATTILYLMRKELNVCWSSDELHLGGAN